VNTKKILVFISVVILIGVGAQIAWLLYDASASPGCNGQSCAEKDPKRFRCDKDAVSVLEQKNLEIRYSLKCNASWPRGAVPKGSILYLEDKKGKVYGVFPVDDAKVHDTKKYYGNMGFGKSFKACAKYKNNSIVCTDIMP
jgi:hypothetical protein